jgi:hypothetical protein
METKYIITLREPINTGSGVTKLLEVEKYWGPDAASLHCVGFEIKGERGLLPVKNISGIYPEKKSK